MKDGRHALPSLPTPPWTPGTASPPRPCRAPGTVGNTHVTKKFSDLDKKIDSKFDKLLLLIVGGLIVKGGFDIFRDERNYARSINYPIIP
ncbi:hypothetical protein HOY80DRAFT_1047043 [Tuber brumale]|nr:hypothetical protein HOY80DRAFT_1047043 [Tuber brumale]